MQVHEHRASVAESTSEARVAMLKKLAEYGDRLTSLADAFPNATAWVSRAGLGSQERG